MRNGRRSLRQTMVCLMLLVTALPPGYTQSIAAYADNKTNEGYKPQEESQTTLQRALKNLEQQHDVYIIYNLKAVGNKTVPAQRRSGSGIQESLHNVLDPLGLKFEQVKENVYVVVMPGEVASDMSAANSPLSGVREKSLTDTYLRLNERFSQGSFRVSASEKDLLGISGRVTDEEGETLVGASILLKGTSIGTTTNVSGNYTFDVPNGEGTLVFSYIGYITQEVPINNRTVIDVSLAPDVQALQEVQIVGYGTQAKAEVTSAIASVTSEEIKDMPLVGLDQALQGRAAGVQVTNNSGAPGGGVSIRIRGTSSLGAGNEPPLVEKLTLAVGAV